MRDMPILSKSDQSRLDYALAALIASTRRRRRKLTLVEVADNLRTATALLGSHRAVADAISLSYEAVRQYARVDKLSPAVKQLAASGELTGIDLADRLSRFQPRDQLPVARRALSGELTTADVRALLDLRKTLPKARLIGLVERIKRSGNIIEYVAEFPIPTPCPTRASLVRRLSKVLGRRHLLRLELGDNIGRAVMNRQGRSALEFGARDAGTTKQEFLQRLVADFKSR